MSLTTRVFLGTAAVVVAVVVAAFVSVAISVRHASDVAARRALDQSADLVAQFLAGRERTLEGGARVFVQGPYFRTLVAERRRDDVLDRAFEAAEQIDADWVFITDENGVLIAKSDEPGVTGIAMGQVPLVAGALRGQVTSGFGASGDTTVFQAVAVPIVAGLGAPAGVLVATRVVDSLFVHDVRAATSSELVFFSRDEHGRAHPAASTLGPPGALSPVLATVPGASTAPGRAEARSDRDGANAQSRVQFAGTEYIARGTSLSTAGGDVVGGFLVMRTRDGAAGGTIAVRGPLLVAVSVGLLVALLAAFAAARFVVRPVHALSHAVARAADGDLHEPLGLPHGVESVREIRELASAFESLMSDLRDKAALLAVAPSRSSMLDRDRHAIDDDAAPVRTARAVGARSARPGALPLQVRRPGLVLGAGAVLANRYLIEAELGRGGLGIVYRAVDRVLGETVAIKMLRPEIVASDDGAFDRLKAELRVTRMLSHRNIVRTHDIGEAEDAPFFTMEYVDGASLATVIQSRGPLAPSAVLSVAKQLLRALSVAHDHGIVHGDLKPQNLLIGSGGVLKVTDFGVARLVRGGKPARVAGDDSLSRLSGAVLGTPEYMAPEQLIGEPSSTRTDIYAAGIVLHECITGSTPYSADTPVAFVARKLQPDDSASKVPPLHITQSTETSGEIDALVELMMDPRVDSRPASARDLLARFATLG